MQSYTKLISDSLTIRKSVTSTPALPVTVAIVAATCCYIVAAIFFVPKGETSAYHFQFENGAATALSAIFLAAAGTLSLATFTTIRHHSRPYAWVWLILAGGFAFLSFDELLQFHERVGRLIERVGDSGIFRSWNDVIVIAYGLLAIPILAGILPGLIRSPKVFELFAIGFSFYAIHTLIDSTHEPPTTASIIAEESCKLLCGAFLVIGSWIGFVNSLLADTAKQ